MKFFLSRNIALIIIIFIFGLWGIYCANEYKTWWLQNNYAYDYYTVQCETEYKNIEKYKAWCAELSASGRPVKPDTITVFFDLIGNYSLRYLQIIAPIFIIAMSIWNFHKELKSEFYKNIITKIEYKKYIQTKVVGSMKYSLFLPLFLLFVLLLSYLLSGHFDINSTIVAYPGSLLIDARHLKNFSMFIIVYISNLILHSIFWINIGFIMAKKSKNILVTLISSFLCYISIFIVSELFIGGFLLSKTFGVNNAMNYLNLANIWVYSGVENIFLLPLYGLFLVVLSYLILAYFYRIKESVIIENEK